MNKTKTIALVLMLALLLTACAPVTAPQDDKLPVGTQAPTPTETSTSVSTQVSTAVPTETTGTTDSEVTLEEQVIFERDGIRVTAVGLIQDDFWGPGVKVLVENNATQNITVQTRNCSVNGLMVEPMFSCDVAAGKKAYDTILFMDDQLEAAQIYTISNIEFYLHIFNSDSWDDIMDSEIIALNTSAVDHVQAYNDSGFIAYDDGRIKIVIQKLNSTDSFWGSDVYVYVENNTASNITVQARDVSANGFMVDPIFSCDIAAGKKAYDTIIFLETDLENNGITDITDLELKFTVFDYDTWDDILDTDIVAVTFE